jgi:hypothetical protein
MPSGRTTSNTKGRLVMFGRTRTVAVGLLAIGALGLGVGTAQAQSAHQTLAESAAAGVIAPAFRIPRPGQDDGDDGNFQAPRHIRGSAPSASGGQAGGSASGGAVPGAAAAPTPGPVSGLLAPVVGALHL